MSVHCTLIYKRNKNFKEKFSMICMNLKISYEESIIISCILLYIYMEL